MKYLIPFLGILLILLIVRLFFYFESRPVYKNGEKVQFSHTLLSEPRRTGYYQIIRVDNLKVFLPLLPRYHYGDTIEIQGVVQEGEYISKNNNALIKEIQLRNPQVQLKERDKTLAVITFIRQRVSDIAHSYLPPSEASLLLGIVFGIREGIDQQTYEALRKAGLLHVVAASGANVSIVSAFLLFISSRFVGRKVSYLVVVGGVVVYSLLSGFDASILRASLMAGISFLAFSFGRQNLSLLSLLLTAWILLVISPKLLADVSFQLSFMATLGIIQIKPLLDRVHSLRSIPFLSEDITTTLSAQLGVFPILILTFGSFPLFSVPINLFVLWTIPFIMMLGGVGILVGFVLPFLSLPFLYLSYPLLWFFLWVVDLSKPIVLEVQFKEVSLLFIIGYVLLLTSLVLALRRKRYE